MSALLEVDGLSVTFRSRRGETRAVDGFGYTLEAGETLGIVGESGSGKSVAHLGILGLLPSSARVEASRLTFAGRDLLTLREDERRKLRGREMAIVFQDPMSALNPLLPIGLQLSEVLEVHENATRRDARRRAAAALGEVGISDPEARLDVCPHEMSGGMRQRVGIAMALLCRPKLLVADEPTTALDVTIQAQVLDLLRDLQKKHGTAIAFITHSLGEVAGLCDRVLVMYAGRVVESAGVDALFSNPLHPYTRGLLASVPRIDGDVSRPLRAIPGSPASLVRTSTSCAFALRCALAEDRCGSARPALESHQSPDPAHRAACFRAGVPDPAESAP
ncbi:MAG: ABC transporter ATP-binding protein [Planctomycetota bacterium]|nr:ABC transporter ATP-binding protein [Planctomycetota bacterium]